MLVNVSVVVEQAPQDLMAQLAKIVVAVKAAGGISIGAIPEEVAALIAGLPPIVSDCQALSASLKESPLAFVKGLVVGLDQVVEAILVSPPAAPPSS